MKWIYIFAGILIYAKFLILPNPESSASVLSGVESIVNDSGIPNAVTAIILRNRLYDTIFEVVVFTIATMGVYFLLGNEKPLASINQFSDQPSIVLARLGAMISALVGIELA
ncbi:MAG: putative Na+/H+ antiporter MnhB subunit-related protein, partial [Cyanobacteriota bacterium]